MALAETERENIKADIVGLKTDLKNVCRTLDELRLTMDKTTDLLHKIDKSTDNTSMRLNGAEERIKNLEIDAEKQRKGIWKLYTAIVVISSGGTLIFDKILNLLK